MCLLNKRGSTLIEILVAALVFVIALGALLSSIVGVLYLVDNAREETVANSDLRNMMEKIRATAFSGMQPRFPNAVVDGPNTGRYSTLLGGYTLRSEHITVSYPNPNADPLEVRVSITWQDKRGRTLSASMSTSKTR